MKAWIILISILCLAGGAGAQEAAEAPDQRPGPSPTGLRRGATEWGLVLGGGFAHPIWGGRGDREFLSLGGRIGRILRQAPSRGPLRGDFEVSLDAVPAFFMFQEQTAYGASFTLLFRQYFAPGRRLRPVVSLGAGVLVSSREIPPGTARLNFTPQVGFGIAYFATPRLAYLGEYRLHHISNAGLAEPNPGINSSYLQFGLSFFR